MRWLRHALRLGGHLVAYSRSSGRWWVLAVSALLVVGLVLALTAKAAVPTAVYTIF